MQLVKRWCEQRDVTQEQFGDEIGVTQGTVSLWFTGERRPSLDNLLSISTVTKIPIEKLIADLRKQVA